MHQLSHRDVLAMMEPVGYLTDPSPTGSRNLRFALHPDRQIGAWEDAAPAVYAWVIGADTAPDIIYLGKAGKGLTARCRQHEQGFKGKDGKGRYNGDKLVEYMAAGQVDLYAMWPEPLVFRNVPIPSHSAVEDWLLSVIDRPPALNREAAAKARIAAIAAGTHTPKPRKPRSTG